MSKLVDIDNYCLYNIFISRKRGVSMYSDGYYGEPNGCNSDLAIGIFFIVILFVAIFSVFGMIASKEARRQGRDTTAWFFLGFFFTFNAFIALKVSKSANEEGRDMKLWSTLGVFFGIYAVIAFESGLNAENKEHDFDCWVLMGFFFGIIALLVSCFLKPFENKGIIETNKAQEQQNLTKPKAQPLEKWVCKNCGVLNPASKMFCQNCGSMKNEIK